MAEEQPSHKSRRPLRWGSLLEKSSSVKTGLANISTVHNESVTDLHRNTSRDRGLEDDDPHSNFSYGATTIRRLSSLPPRLRQQQKQQKAHTGGLRENKPALISDEDTLFEDEDMEDTWRSQHRTIASSSSTSSPIHSTSRSSSMISTLTPTTSSTQCPGQISTEEHNILHNDGGHPPSSSSSSSSRRMEVVVESKAEFTSETTTMDLKNDNSSSSPRATKITTIMGTQTPSSHSTIQDSTRILSSRTLLVEELGSELPLTKKNDPGLVDPASVFEQAVQRIANKHKKKVTGSSSPPKEKIPKEESFQPRSSSRSKSPSKKAKRVVSSSNSRPPGDNVLNQSQEERPLAIPLTSSSSIAKTKKTPITKAPAVSAPSVVLSGPQQQEQAVELASPTMPVHNKVKKPRSGRDLAQLLQTSSPDFFASMASNFGDDFNDDDDDPSSSSHSNNSTLVALPPLPKNMKNRRDLFQKTKSVPVLPVSSRRRRPRHTEEENIKSRNYSKQEDRRSKTGRSSNSTRRRRSKSPTGGSTRRTSSSKSRRHHRSRSTSQGETTTSSRTQSYSPRRQSRRLRSTTSLGQSNPPNKQKTSSNRTREASLQQRKGQWKAMDDDKQRSRSSSANKSRRHSQHTELTTTTTISDAKSRAGRKPQKEEVRKPNSTSSSESFTLDWNTTSEVLHSSQEQQLHHSESFLQAFLLGQMEHVEDSAHAQRQNVQEKDKYKAELQSIQSDPIAVSPTSRKISTKHVARKMKGAHPVENELENSIVEQFRRIKSLEVPPSPGLASLYAPSPKRDDEDDDDVPKRHLSVGGAMRRRKKALDTEKFVHFGLDLASTTTVDQNLQTSASSTMNATRQLPRQQEIEHEVISVPDTSGHGKLVDRLKRLNSKEKPTVPSPSLNGSSSRLLQLSQERANSPLKTSHKSDDGAGDSSTEIKPSRSSGKDEGGNLAQDITEPPSRSLSLESYRNSSKSTPTGVPSKSSVREKSPAPAAGQPRNRQMVRNGGMGTSLAATLEKNAAPTTIHEGTVLRVKRSSASSVCSDLTDAFASPSLEFSTRTRGPVIASIEAMDVINEKDGGNGDTSAHSENSWLGLNTSGGDPTSDPQHQERGGFLTKKKHPSLVKTSALELPPSPAKRRASRDDSSMGSSTLHRRAHLTKKWMSTGQILLDAPKTPPIRSTDDDDDPTDKETSTTTTKKGRFQWIKKKLLGKKLSEDKGNI